jgi:hypothetical protein
VFSSVHRIAGPSETISSTEFSGVMKRGRRIIFLLLATNFMGSNKADDCNELVENLLLSYQKLGWNVSLKILFLHYQQDFFRKTVALSNEHGECFRHDISAVEMRYQGKCSSPILADYYCTVTRDSPGLLYKLQVKRRRN